MVSGAVGVIVVLGFPLLMLTTMIGMHRVEQWAGGRSAGRALHLVPALPDLEPDDPYPDDPFPADPYPDDPYPDDSPADRATTPGGRT